MKIQERSMLFNCGACVRVHTKCFRPGVCLSFCIIPCFVLGPGLCVMSMVNHDPILIPDEFILKYQQHHKWVLQYIAVPIFRPQLSVFQWISLFLSPLPPLSLLVWLISISSLAFFFFLPVQFFDWQVIISYPIFRGKTVIHWRRHVAALWTSFSVTCGELRSALGVTLREAERDTCSWFLSQHLKEYDSLFFFLRLRSDGSTERNSRGVYQTDRKLKTCYCWKKVRPVDCVWWSWLLIVWSVNKDDNTRDKETACLYSLTGNLTTTWCCFKPICLSFICGNQKMFSKISKLFFFLQWN